ncbi:hypothetical protein BH09MYX1_BH09MYX1_14650 [soil metagenome]
MQLRHPVVVAALVAWASACSSSPPEAPATTVLMDYARPSGLFDAPFPDESARRSDGTIDISKFPNLDSAIFVNAAWSTAARDARGFSQTSTIFFRTSAPLKDTFADPALTTTATSVIQIVDIDPASPEKGNRVPVIGSFSEDPGPYGQPNLLGLTPYQGIPLRRGTLHAAVVLRSLGDASGHALAQPAAIAQLIANEKPPAMSDAAFAVEEVALAGLASAGVPKGDIAGIAVFRTDDSEPTIEAVLADALPRAKLSPTFAASDVYDDYCVYDGMAEMPAYQIGIPPYTAGGGYWTFGPGGEPLFQRFESARVFLTVPRRPMPSGGFPTVVFSRTGAGGDRALVDRGVRDGQGNAVQGTGLAHDFARVGVAGITVDGPLGGIRNPDQSDEQFLIFNIANPAEIRDNVRQSAVELAIVAHLVDQVSVDASACPGFTAQDGKARIDAAKLALLGHSMGATIAPLALAIEPRFGAALLSGAGGSWIDNVLYKEKPLIVRPLAELLVGYTSSRRKLVVGDPALALVQWAAEAADPPLYGHRIVTSLGQGRARHVLMFQGIVDHYIMPPMANTASVAFGLDFGGAPLDGTTAELSPFTPALTALALVDRHALPFPIAGNVKHADGSASTAVVSQYAADGVEDGHEVLFQRSDTKYQLRCFLAKWASGAVPSVPAPIASEDLCP